MNIDVSAQKRMDDNWNVDGNRRISRQWTCVAQFTKLSEEPPSGYTWFGVRLTQNSSNVQPPIIYGWRPGKICRNAFTQKRETALGC